MRYLHLLAVLRYGCVIELAFWTNHKGPNNQMYLSGYASMTRQHSVSEVWKWPGRLQQYTNALKSMDIFKKLKRGAKFDFKRFSEDAKRLAVRAKMCLLPCGFYFVDIPKFLNYRSLHNDWMASEHPIVFKYLRRCRQPMAKKAMARPPVGLKKFSIWSVKRTKIVVEPSLLRNWKSASFIDKFWFVRLAHIVCVPTPKMLLWSQN